MGTWERAWGLLSEPGRGVELGHQVREGTRVGWLQVELQKAKPPCCLKTEVGKWQRKEGTVSVEFRRGVSGWAGGHGSPAVDSVPVPSGVLGSWVAVLF